MGREDEVGIVDEGARDEKSALHAARELLDLGVRLLGELDKLQELAGSLPRHLARQVEVAVGLLQALGNERGLPDVRLLYTSVQGLTLPCCPACSLIARAAAFSLDA